MSKKGLLEEAERKYPIGTIFTCARDKKQKGTRIDKLKWDKEHGGSIYTMFKGSSYNQYIYDNRHAHNKWAKIKLVPINNSYEIY